MNPRRCFLVWVVLASTTWLAWMAALPWLLEAGPVARPLAVAAALTYRIGGVVCHQDPARSFTVSGVQMPVCARCAGLYTGAALGGLLTLGWFTRQRRSAARLATVRLVLIACALPTACLWLAEWLIGLPVGNGLRWAGAVPLGGAVAWAIAMAIAGRLPTDTRPVSGVH